MEEFEFNENLIKNVSLFDKIRIRKSHTGWSELTCFLYKHSNSSNFKPNFTEKLTFVQIHP